MRSAVATRPLSPTFESLAYSNSNNSALIINAELLTPFPIPTLVSFKETSHFGGGTDTAPVPPRAAAGRLHSQKGISTTYTFSDESFDSV